MTEIEMSFYYDKSVAQVLKLPANGTYSADYILITEAHANALSVGVREGAVIYLNSANTPALFTSPPKPVLKWDETAVKTPVTVIDGVASQQWLVNKLSVPEKLEILKQLRNTKLYSTPFKMAIAERNPDGSKIYKDCITDPATINLTSLTYGTALRKPDAAVEHWKFEDGTFHRVLMVDLIEAWDSVHTVLEGHFSIEALYTSYILAGIEVDITQWERLPALVAPPIDN